MLVQVTYGVVIHVPRGRCQLSTYLVVVVIHVPRGRCQLSTYLVVVVSFDLIRDLSEKGGFCTRRIREHTVMDRESRRRSTDRADRDGQTERIVMDRRSRPWWADRADRGGQTEQTVVDRQSRPWWTDRADRGGQT